MNEDQVTGIAKSIVGKVQQKAGKLTGSKALQQKGLDKQIAGNAQKTYGDAKEVVRNAFKGS